MRPRQFTDEALLETARRCFLEQGPGVSTSVIAKELGVSQAALFKRFKTKQALMMAALAPPGIPAWVESVMAGPDERPVPEQLRSIVEGIDDFFAGMMPSLTVLHAAGFDPKCMMAEFEVPPPTAAHRALTAWLSALHESGRAYVPAPKSTAMTFLGTIHARHMLGHVLGEHAPQTEPEFLSNLVDLIWAGIDPARSPSSEGGSR